MSAAYGQTNKRGESVSMAGHSVAQSHVASNHVRTGDLLSS